MIVPVTAILSMYAAISGAEAAGIHGGSWGWGFMLAVPGGLLLGFILSGTALAVLKQKAHYSFIPVLASAFGVAAVVFVVSFIAHGVLKILF